MNRTYDPAKAIAAQAAYVKQWAAKHPADIFANSFARGEGFAPSSGRCYRCKKQIYADGGISVEEASTRFITGCPYCHFSYVE